MTFPALTKRVFTVSDPNLGRDEVPGILEEVDAIFAWGGAEIQRRLSVVMQRGCFIQGLDLQVETVPARVYCVYANDGVHYPVELAKLTDIADARGYVEGKPAATGFDVWELPGNRVLETHCYRRHLIQPVWLVQFHKYPANEDGC